MWSRDHALHYSASRGKNSAYVVTHHSVLFIYLTLSFPLAWPRPREIGLDLIALASASASKLWPRPRSSGLGLSLKILASFNITDWNCDAAVTRICLFRSVSLCWQTVICCCCWFFTVLVYRFLHVCTMHECVDCWAKFDRSHWRIALSE